MWTVPKRATVSSTTAAMSSFTLTSQRTARTTPSETDWISRLAAARRSSFRAQMQTSQPSPASSFATARPRPEFPPVTMAALP